MRGRSWEALGRRVDPWWKENQGETRGDIRQTGRSMVERESGGGGDEWTLGSNGLKGRPREQASEELSETGLIQDGVGAQ